MDDEDRKKNLPEEYDGTLDCSSLALCCSFNRIGSLLAVGCNDGRVVIWDFLNRNIAKNIIAHAGHPVASTSWSRDGRRLASASLDNTVAIWNVLTGECNLRWTFKAPLMKVQFNPRDDNLIVVCPFKHPPILLKIDYDSRGVRHKAVPTDKDDSECNVVASFDRRGNHIYTGGSRGRISIFKSPYHFDDTNPLEIVSSFKIQPIGSAPAAISELEFANNKKYFLVNSTDRSIRLYSCDNALNAGIDGSCDELKKFQDTVNKTMWKRCCFSGDREATFVCGGSARQNALYIWGTEDGTVKKFLQGLQREMLLDIQWHPKRPVVASVSSGLISIWARAEVENWSAYAPEFQELEENQEYSEHESEFDIEDEDKARIPKTKSKSDDNEEQEIDIMNVDHNEEFYSSSDEEIDPANMLEYIPISLEDHEIVELPIQ